MPAKKMFETIVTVRGSGHFPLDMLRYDTCYPESETDALTIEHDNTDRIVQLRRRSTVVRAPEGLRWASFGWKVVSVEPVH